MPRRMHSAEPSARSVNRQVLFERDGVRLNRLDYRARHTQGLHEHEFASITLVMRGDCREQSEFDDHVSQACTVLVKPAHVPHANNYGEEMVSLQIAFKPNRALPIGDVCTHFDGGAPAASMIGLLRATNTCPPAALAPYIRHAMTTVGNAAVAQSARELPAWLSELSDQLMRDLASTLSIRSLARDAGLHPVSLARIFRRHYGSSITEFVRRARIVHASRRIAAGDASLVDIAADTGFADQPHFTRAFRAELGCTPGEFRRLVV